MSEKVKIETSDLYFAAFLKASNCEIVETKKDYNKTIFIFEDPEDRDLKKSYFDEEESSAIPALTFANTIRSLKTMCYIR